MTKIADLWAQRVRLDAEVKAADQACDVADRAGDPKQMKATEKRWGALWDQLHDLDDEIMKSSATDQTDIAMKACVFSLRSNEDLPYLHYARRIAADVIALATQCSCAVGPWTAEERWPAASIGSLFTFQQHSAPTV